MDHSTTGPNAATADQACAREAIHIPGSVQPHGILLAFDGLPASPCLLALSDNAASLPSLATSLDDNASHSPFKRDMASLLGEALASQLLAFVQADHAGPDAIEGAAMETVATLPGRDTSFSISAHQHDGLLIVELEPTATGDAESAINATRRLQHAIARLRAGQGDLAHLATAAVRDIRAMTGYERVLVYRFDTDWHGEAIAEDRVEDWDEGFLGLHFPASDIPAQARALYCRSLLRWTPDRDAMPVKLRVRPASLPEHPEIDLSHARLRSPSPIHMQYHRNMGVNGTMSISIMVGTRLWGLVVCHHRKPHRTSHGQRAAAAALTDAFSLRILPAERAGTEAARTAGHQQVSQLIARMAQIDDLAQALGTGPVTLTDLFGAGSAAIVLGKTVTPLSTAMGAALPKADLLALAAWLRENAPPGDIFSTESLPDRFPAWLRHGSAASGLMAVFLTEDRAEMLLWFRPEEPREVSWGGRPTRLPGETPLLPRLSFERWVEVRHGHAKPWQAWEHELAALLRHAITEVIVRNLRRIASLSEQLRQSQKMEAVGQLTGGLAHDFNNLLGGIVGSLELAQIRLKQGRTENLERYLMAATHAANRAAALTHRLLAFSRRQTLDPVPTDVARLVGSMEDLVRRTVGPSIQLECVTSAGLWTILCDGNQLENAILNLAINAWDAMPDGGRLTIEASNARLEDEYAAEFGLPPGHYVAISVSDTGTGMPPETIQRAFEPFFTTKPIGEGTGLGLSMVYGFTKQSGGHARIYSEIGHGTSIRLYLPRHLGAPSVESAAAPPEAAPVRAGRSTVLLVDDEPVLRMLVGEVLEELGFIVVEASDGPRALALLEHDRRIDLLITDVGLPGGLNGRQVADAARVKRPELKVLFITGYAETAALGGGLLDPATQVLTKPFEMSSLRGKVRAMTA